MKMFTMNVVVVVMAAVALGTPANAQMKAPKLNLQKAGRAPAVRSQSSNAGASSRPYSTPQRRYAQNRQWTRSSSSGGLKQTETTIRSRPQKPKQGTFRPMPKPVNRPRGNGNDVLDINNRHENQGHRKPLEVRAQRTIESWGGGLSSALGW